MKVKREEEKEEKDERRRRMEGEEMEKGMEGFGSRMRGEDARSTWKGSGRSEGERCTPGLKGIGKEKERGGWKGER